MRVRTRVILFAIVLGLLNSCDLNKKDSESEISEVIDVFEKFEIELPSN